MTGFTLVATVKIKPGKAVDFASTAKALVAWVKDNEPYVDSYNVYEDGDTAAFVDHYVDDDAFMAHMSSKAGTELLPACLANADIVQVQTFGATSEEVAQTLKGFHAQQFGTPLASAGR